MTDDEIFIYLALGATCLNIGTAFLMGAIKKWKFIIDPPEDLWMFYSQSFVKKFFGKEILILQTYFWGVVGILVGLYCIYKVVNVITF